MLIILPLLQQAYKGLICRKSGNRMAKKQKRRTSDKYHICREMFINQNKSFTEIEQITGVKNSQLSRWSREDEWEIQRTAKSVTRNNIISDLYNNIRDIQEYAMSEGRALNAKESDQIYKLAGSIEKMDQSLTLHHYITVMEEFMTYMRDADQAFSQQMADHYYRFVESKASQIR